MDRHLTIVTPVFNDWESFCCLARSLDEIAAQLDTPISVLAVDDGSTNLPPTLPPEALFHLKSVERISLRCNVGHQRAIAIGLSECLRRNESSVIVVMDSDGEDDPKNLPELFSAHCALPNAIVVASRHQRSEGIAFRAGYALYQRAFRLLTGQAIDFGNYCLLPPAALQRIAYASDSWNHLAAAIVKSKAEIVRVKTMRAKRYAGRSSMDFVSLFAHGFRAISVFSDTVLMRMLVIFGTTSLAAVGFALTAIIFRLFTDLAIPGWATTVVGISAVLFFQSITLLAVMIFTNLANRSNVPFIPATSAGTFIRAIEKIHPDTHERT